MGRMYTVPFVGVAVTAQQDLFEIVAPATAVVVIHGFFISQSTEVGDAQEEGLSLLTKSGQTTTGSGGSSVTPATVMFGDVAAGAVCKANNTTKASAGTIVTHRAYNWNVRAPFDKVFTPEARPILAPSRRWTLELATTPADSITMSGYVTIEELG